MINTLSLKQKLNILVENDDSNKVQSGEKREEEQEIEERAESEVREKEEDFVVLSFKLKHKNQECDELGKRVFDLTQEMKIASDRIKQLENHKYRAEVIKLEEKVEEKQEPLKN